VLSRAAGDHQARVAEALAIAGATVSLGWYHEVETSAVARAVAELSGNPSRLREMSRSAAAITDGAGAERVAEVFAQSSA
jgi:spore coat polysaccharide biosynthesis predicted glycosyltransferase SpsG